MPHVPLQTDVAALINMCTKPMQLAQYFCTGESIDNLEEQTQFDLKDINMKTWGHYALAMSHYTHFTSPIRRYPDVLVHRLLAAALDQWDNEPFAYDTT